MDKAFESLWVEKYRPKSITDVVLPDALQHNVKQWLESRNMPHVLFYGPAGSGKTTTALILAEAMADEEDRLVINGSYYRGIHDVRNQILPFVRQSPLSTKSALRIVLIDEADSITGDAWKALRHIIESYCKYSRFILTCNWISKIPEPIQSRMQTYEFKEYDKDSCLSILSSILELENVKYTIEQVRFVIDILYPDLRKMINTLQSLVVSQNGHRVLDTSNIEQVLPAEDAIVKIVESFFNRQIDKRTFIREVEKIVKTKWVDYTGVYSRIFELIPMQMLKLKVLCNEYAYRHTQAISEDMNFLAFIYELAMNF